MKKNGFVFLETIIVISILSLTLVLLFSSYSYVLRKSKEKNTFDNIDLTYKTYYTKDIIDNYKKANAPLAQITSMNYYISNSNNECKRMKFYNSYECDYSSEDYNGILYPAKEAFEVEKLYYLNPSEVLSSDDKEGWLLEFDATTIDYIKELGKGTDKDIMIIKYKKDYGNGDYEVFHSSMEDSKTVPRYTLILHGNSGTVNGKETQRTYNLKFDELPVPEKLGYLFDGWFTEETGGVKVTNENFENLVIMELYAQWSPITFYVAFNGNNATSGGINKITCTYDQDCIIPENNFLRTGYTYQGWNVGSTSGEFRANKANVRNIATVHNSTTTLYAKWKNNTYTINYVAHDATSGTTPSSKHTYDIDKKLNKNGFARKYFVTFNSNYSGGPMNVRTSNYTFAGWKYKGNVYGDEQAIKNLSSIDNDNITLTATWTPVGVSLDTPIRNGYKFLGWYTEPYGGTKINGTTYTPTQNITLYAHWEIENYTITYSLGGGSATGLVYSYNILTPTISISNPTKNNYTFLGWTGSNSSTPQLNVTIPKGSYGNKSYTANFRGNKYTIKYNGNGSTSGNMDNSVFYYDTENYLIPNNYRRKYSLTLDYNYLGGPVYVKTAEYTFNGWEYNGNYYANQQKVKNLSNIENSIVILNAMWIPSYIVLPYPTRIGFNFLGWYTLPYGGTKIYDTLYIPTKDDTLYANWQLQTYGVSISINNGSATVGGVPISALNINYGGTSQFVVTPNDGYYLESINCNNGYTVSDYSTGKDATSAQIVTISNNGVVDGAACSVSIKKRSIPATCENADYKAYQKCKTCKVVDLDVLSIYCYRLRDGVLVREADGLLHRGNCSAEFDYHEVLSSPCDYGVYIGYTSGPFDCEDEYKCHDGGTKDGEWCRMENCTCPDGTTQNGRECYYN